LILPPAEIPSNLRGVTISVTFLVDPQGRVDQVRFSPEPNDRGFAKKLEEVMRSYRFRPARGPDGLPVAGSVAVQLTF
jgi:TonB family protein